VYALLEILTVPTSISELNAAIVSTNFVAVAQLGLTFKLIKIYPPEVKGILEESPVECYLDATLLPSFFEHITSKINLCFLFAPEGPVIVMELHKWLGQTIIFMLLKLRFIKNFFKTQEITINFPNQENRLSRDHWC
jgi:hypothetical protein